MNVTTQEIQDAIKMMGFACEAIRDAGHIGEGVLYAAFSTKLGKSAFDSMITQILRTGLVKRENNLLSWIA